MNRNMKDSGVEWIGEIPEDWEVARIKNIAKIFTGNSISDKEKNNYNDLQDSIPYISTKNINLENSSLEYDTGIYIKNGDTKFKVANKGCTLLCIEGGSAGKKIAILNQKVAFVNKLCCFEVFNLNNKYTFYYLSSYAFKEQFNQYISGLIGGVSQNYIKNFNILIPNNEKQKLIAETLDKKCTQIDTFIQNQQQQIEKLKQYKQSLITETVTKGLEPNVPMKDSEVEWIGEIPKDWEVSRIKNVLSIITDYTSNGSFKSLAENVNYLDYKEYARVIRLTDLRVNMKNEGIYVTKDAYDYLSKSALFGEEILVANVGAYAGLFCEMPKIDYNATLGPNMFLLKTNECITSRMLYYIGQSQVVYNQLFIKAVSSTQPKLNKHDVKTVYIILPKKSQQNDLTNYLDKKCSQIDNLIKIKEQKIEKLNDYKKSIIYEYVTGKKEA